MSFHQASEKDWDPPGSHYFWCQVNWIPSQPFTSQSMPDKSPSREGYRAAMEQRRERGYRAHLGLQRISRDWILTIHGFGLCFGVFCTSTLAFSLALSNLLTIPAESLLPLSKNLMEVFVLIMTSIAMINTMVKTWGERVCNMTLDLSSLSDLSTTDSMKVGFRLYNSVSRQHHLPKLKQRPDPSNYIVLGKSLNALTLFCSFYSSISV